MRCLKAIFSADVVDCTSIDEVHHIEDYTASRVLGFQLRKNQEHGVKYNSVRNDQAICWGLFSPTFVSSIIQTKHYEFVFDGQSISSVRELAIK